MLDQSLHQCGIEGKAALQKYWKNDVKGYARRLQLAATEHQDEYLRLTVSVCVCVCCMHVCVHVRVMCKVWLAGIM